MRHLNFSMQGIMERQGLVAILHEPFEQVQIRWDSETLGWELLIWKEHNYQEAPVRFPEDNSDDILERLKSLNYTHNLPGYITLLQGIEIKYAGR